jgi:hypothetical protein
VKAVVDAPIERAFADVSDHEVCLSQLGTICRLTREGTPHRNGQGAVREVVWGSLTFSEEILAFDPPRRFDYVIRQLVNNKTGRSQPIKHERGWMLFHEEAGRTHIDWHSQFRVPIPILGWFLERMVGARTRAAFSDVLARAKARIEGARDRETSAVS